MTRFPILCLLAALLWSLAASPVRAQNVDVVIGYFAADAAQRPRRVDVGSLTYVLQQATMPADRQQIRVTKTMLIDQFPEGGELFRDDMEAFHYMIHEGGLLVLVTGPNRSAQTTANFNYLGTRFDFEILPETLSGAVAPVVPTQGPLDGNTWALKDGALGFRFSNPEWRTWFRHPDSGKPVIASRRIGKGMLLLVGTHELDHRDGARMHNALTLIDWALREVEKPTAEGRTPPPPPQASAGAVETVSEAEKARILAHPSSDLLKSRIAELRRAYAVSASPSATASLLVPRAERQYLPFRPNMSDVDDRIFSVPDYQGLVAVIVFWASWDPESRRMLEANAETIKQIKGQGVAVIGFSLDRDRQAAMDWMKSKDLSFRLICDGKGWANPLAEATDTRRLPRFILLDATGRVAHPDLHPADLVRATAEARAEK
jgi:hypothetical protein